VPYLISKLKIFKNITLELYDKIWHYKSASKELDTSLDSFQELYNTNPEIVDFRSILKKK
jgi:hypothetical protein